MWLKLILPLACVANLVFAQAPGVITDTVFTKVDRQQFYALCLPSSYTAERKFPLILFFDPAARGTEPLKHYRALAERYQCIMACSYNSRNGSFQPSIEAAYAMLDDIKERFQVNTNAMFVSGFSGGARLSSFLAIRDRQFAGVIACGATFPTESKISRDRKIPYAIVVGDVDMNFLEGVQAEGYLRQIQNPSINITFHGGHAWPPPPAFEKALYWQLSFRSLLDSQQVENLYREQLTSIKQNTDSGKWIEAANIAEAARFTFQAKKRTDALDSAITVITSKKEYQKEKKEQEKNFTIERDWQKKFNEQYHRMMAVAHTDTAFKARDWQTFQKEFARLRASKDADKRLMGERLFDFSWRLFAEQSNMFYEQKDYKRALLHAKVWCVLAPDEFRPWVVAARSYAVQQLNKECLSYLREAFEKGFKNVKFLEHDPAFFSVRTTDAYHKLLQEFPGN